MSLHSTRHEDLAAIVRPGLAPQEDPHDDSAARAHCVGATGKQRAAPAEVEALSDAGSEDSDSWSVVGSPISSEEVCDTSMPADLLSGIGAAVPADENVMPRLDIMALVEQHGEYAPGGPGLNIVWCRNDVPGTDTPC